MLSVEEALLRIAALEVGVSTERVGLSSAGGRVLAQAVALDRDQPGFDRSTMDGYAVCLDGDAGSFEVVATVVAGSLFEGSLSPGQAVRIMTGAPCPRGVTVVPIELTDGGEATVTVTEPAALQPGRNIAWRGEDGHAGDVILEPGTRLGPAALAAAAMAGAESLDVYTLPRVAVITTGDEVGKDGPAGIRDSNGPMLTAFLSGLGLAHTRRHAPDDEGRLEQLLAEGRDRADVVVTVGGVSMGTRDLVPETAAALGFETVLHKVAVQPGKPIFIARNEDGKLFIGLPGNPVSVLVTAHLFLLPALARFWGDTTPPWSTQRLATDWKHTGRRHLFLPAALGDDGVTPVAWNGSGDLLAAAAADGLLDLPVGSDLSAGDRVRFLPFAGHVAGQRAQLPPRGVAGAPC